MRRLIRTCARAGRDSEVWPVALMLFAVLAPAACLLWFMTVAVRNERLAARQKLADAYRSRLALSQLRLERHWKDVADGLQVLARTAPVSSAFAKCVQFGGVDSVIVLDEQGRALYPNVPSAALSVSAGDGPKGKEPENELELKWAEANRLEYSRKDFVAAASQYGALAQETTNVNVAARAVQAQARCLVQAGQRGSAIRVVCEVLNRDRYRYAVDAQGRLIVANAELMALELLTNRAAPPFRSTAQRLKQRLLDYENPVLAAPQRRFLMKELQILSPSIEFPTLSAEELAADFPIPPVFSSPNGAKEKGSVFLRQAWRPGLWQFMTPNRRVLALVRSESLLASSRLAVAADPLAVDADITLLPPDVESASAFMSMPAGPALPGWRLALTPRHQNLFDAAAEYRAVAYLWTGLLVVAGIGVLALSAIWLLRRQVALARLKNDLAATVSHELKTPLSSMRVLVDTLLDADRIEEAKAREYLQLIAQENERLSRLIQNFLTFSRMDRRKYAFDFASLSPRQITDAAIAAMGERFAAPGCRFETQIEDNLPEIRADPDALTAALINLLDNAYKYSEDIKHIVLGVRAENGKVVFSIRDNGIGIAPRQTKKIFRPFQQLDQRLSRKGSGCGLGLSIVQYILNAHDGRVSVESRPGAGSTFTVALPAAPKTIPPVRKEATA